MDEVIGVGLLASIVHHLLDILISHIFLKVHSVDNVFADCSCKKDRLLLNDTNLRVIPFLVEFLDVASIEENLTFLRVVESLNQGDD